MEIAKEIGLIVLQYLLAVGLLYLIYKTFMNRVWMPFMKELDRFTKEVEKTSKAKRKVYTKIEEVVSSKESRETLKRDVTEVLGTALAKGIACGISRLLVKPTDKDVGGK